MEPELLTNNITSLYRMVYLIVVLIISVSIVLIVRQVARQRKDKILEKIRSSWGKPKDESFYFHRIANYSFLSPDDANHRLSSQTLDDIDFQSLFAFIDRTTSKVGQIYLFKQLVTPKQQIDQSIDKSASLFSQDRSFREAIQQQLVKLNSPEAYNLTALLRDRLLDKPDWFDQIQLSLLLIIILLGLSLLYPVFLLVAAIPLAGNMFIHYWNKNNTYQFSSSFSQLNILVDVSQQLTNYQALSNPFISEHITAMRPFQRKLKFLRIIPENGAVDDLFFLVSYLIELFKAFFLIEVIGLFHLTRELEKRKTSIVALIEYVGAIDMALSIASLRAGDQATCIPEFAPSGKSLSVKNIYHPLIKGCTTNDLVVSGKSVLITGSNMSGKSTFLRTLMINSILAQTIFTCFADEYKTPALRQFSSIRIDDNLFEGTSYYLEEVRIMGLLLRESEGRAQNLYALDEVFKGTNTKERIAAAKAILSYLNKNNHIVIVSTHDIELAEMLKHEYDLYHFTESIDADELRFDHKIKPGPLTTRNAIRILEISNYPEAVVSEAKYLSREPDLS